MSISRVLPDPPSPQEQRSPERTGPLNNIGSAVRDVSDNPDARKGNVTSPERVTADIKKDAIDNRRRDAHPLRIRSGHVDTKA
jgi:hypothetical protein